MTVSAVQPVLQYTGTGSSATFAIPFVWSANADLVVQQQTGIGAAPRTLALGTDYTLVGAQTPTGGTLTLTAGNLASGAILTIANDPAEVQGTSLPNGSPYFGSTVEGIADRLTREVQITRQLVNNSIRIPLVESLAGLVTVLPLAAARANQAVLFDASGNVTVGALTPAGSIPAASLIQVVDTIAALKAIAVPISAVSFYVRGYYAAGDGGGGFFRWSASDTTTDNGGTAIAITANGASAGRMERVFTLGYIEARWFGLKGDGLADDTAANTKLWTYIAAQAVANPAAGTYDAYVGRIRVHYSAGSYLLTSATSFMLPPAVGAPTAGIVIEGDGEQVTQILWAPATGGSDQYLVTNGDNGWLNVTMRDIAFFGIGANAAWASFMLSTSAGGPQDYDFDRVRWESFKYGIHLQGTNNNSEFAFWKCGSYGSWTRFLWSETSDQFVNYGFYEHSHQAVTGEFLHFDKGGNIRIYGGNFIFTLPDSSAIFFNLQGASHALGVCNFLCSGSRFELRQGSAPGVTAAQIITCLWGFGSVRFESCDSSSQVSAVAASVTATFDFANLSGPLVTWENCLIQGRHSYGYNTSGYKGSPRVLYECCEMASYNDPTAALVFVADGSNGNAGGLPVIRLRACRGAGPESTGNDDEYVGDTDINWQNNHKGVTQTKWAWFKTPQGASPLDGETQTIILPPNVVVLRAMLFLKAGALVSTTSSEFKIQTTEGSPTVLCDSSAFNLNVGCNVITAQSPPFALATTAQRTLQLTVTGADAAAVGDAFLAGVEYIG